MADGETIVIPAFKHRLAVGAVGWFACHVDGYASPRCLLGGIRERMDAAAQVAMPAGTSWGDAIAQQLDGVTRGATGAIEPPSTR